MLNETFSVILNILLDILGSFLPYKSWGILRALERFSNVSSSWCLEGEINSNTFEASNITTRKRSVLGGGKAGKSNRCQRLLHFQYFPHHQTSNFPRKGKKKKSICFLFRNVLEFLLRHWNLPFITGGENINATDTWLSFLDIFTVFKSDTNS